MDNVPLALPGQALVGLEQLRDDTRAITIDVGHEHGWRRVAIVIVGGDAAVDERAVGQAVMAVVR